MAIIDLLELEPTEISRDLRDKYILLYSLPKVGKTSFAAEIPNNLIFAFEKGFNALQGIYAAPIEKWSDAKAMLRQLRKPEVQAKYSTITIDTVSIAFDLCEESVAQSYGVKTIGEAAWGQGYTAAKKEFSKFLREITLLGYGLILLAHSKSRLEEKTSESGEIVTVEKVYPNIPNYAQTMINATVDLTAYIDVELTPNGSKRTLITRETPYVMAGSRWRFLEAEIPFGYQNLINAIGDAISKQEREEGIQAVSHQKELPLLKSRPFEETVAEAYELWTNYVGESEEKADRVYLLVDELFGSRMKLSEIPEEKQDLFEILIDEMKNL